MWSPRCFSFGNGRSRPILYHFIFIWPGNFYAREKSGNFENCIMSVATMIEQTANAFSRTEKMGQVQAKSKLSLPVIIYSCHSQLGDFGGTTRCCYCRYCGQLSGCQYCMGCMRKSRDDYVFYPEGSICWRRILLRVLKEITECPETTETPGPQETNIVTVIIPILVPESWSVN